MDDVACGWFGPSALRGGGFCMEGSCSSAEDAISLSLQDSILLVCMVWVAVYAGGFMCEGHEAWMSVGTAEATDGFFSSAPGLLAGLSCITVTAAPSLLEGQ